MQREKKYEFLTVINQRALLGNLKTVLGNATKRNNKNQKILNFYK